MLHISDVSRNVRNETDRLSGMAISFTHPDDVLHSEALSLGEKRALLAAWASDAHAVPNRPALRQLDSGAIVGIDAVLDALRALDAAEETATPERPARTSSAKAHLFPLPKWCRPLRGRDDDDDDPPPCPSAALPPGVELELRRRRDKAWGLVAA